jgi:hypothetical protein
MGQVLQAAHPRAVPPLPGATKPIAHLGRLRQLPGQGMFAATAANHQYFHKAVLLLYNNAALW